MIGTVVGFQHLENEPDFKFVQNIENEKDRFLADFGTVH